MTWSANSPAGRVDGVKLERRVMTYRCATMPTPHVLLVYRPQQRVSAPPGMDSSTPHERKASAMRVIFAGTPEFARVALERLHAAGFAIPLVLTQPDRPAGRGMKLQPRR
jgi:hypothetical protein